MEMLQLDLKNLKTKVKKRKNSRRKGAQGERDAAKVFVSRGIEAERAQQYKGTKDSGDLNIPRLDAMGLHNEIKRAEQVTLNKWFVKTDDDLCGLDDVDLDLMTPRTPRDRAAHALERRVALEASDKRPFIMHKRNDEEWFVSMRAEDFITLIKHIPTKINWRKK